MHNASPAGLTHASAPECSTRVNEIKEDKKTKALFWGVGGGQLKRLEHESLLKDLKGTFLYLEKFKTETMTLLARQSNRINMYFQL